MEFFWWRISGSNLGYQIHSGLRTPTFVSGRVTNPFSILALATAPTVDLPFEPPPFEPPIAITVDAILAAPCQPHVAHSFAHGTSAESQQSVISTRRATASGIASRTVVSTASLSATGPHARDASPPILSRAPVK